MKRLVLLLALIFSLVGSASLVSGAVLLDNGANSTTGWRSFDGQTATTFSIDTSAYDSAPASIYVYDGATGAGSYGRYGTAYTANATGDVTVNATFYLRVNTTSPLHEWTLRADSGSGNTYVSDVFALIQVEGGNFRAYDANAGGPQVLSTSPSADTWYKVSFLYNLTSGSLENGRYAVYIDDGYEGTFDYAWANVTPYFITVQATGSASTGQAFIDSIVIDDGSTPPSNATVVTLTAVDAYDGSSITEFNASISISTGGSVGDYSTTNGTIVTNITSNSTDLYNITFTAADYFENTSTNVNVSSGSYEGSLAQNLVTYQCWELYTNDTLSCYTDEYFPKGTGTFTDQVNVSGYHPVNVTYTLSATQTGSVNCPSGYICPSPTNYSIVYAVGFYDHKLNITAEDYTGSPLSNFTIFYNSSTLSGSESDNNTGSVQLELFQNDTYTIEIVENIPSGTERNNSIQSATINVPESAPATTQFYQFNLSYPSLTITVLDEDTGVLVPGNTTLTFVEGNSSFEKTVVNGTGVFNASNSIPSGTYDIQFENEDYSDRTYSLTYNRTYPQSLTAYLVNTSSPSVVFILEDRETRNVVEGATITVQRFVNGSLTTVNVLTSDITGRTSFDYLTDEQYRFQITHADYTSRNFTLDPILFSSYTILLDSPTSVGETEGDYSGIGYVFTSTTFTEQETNSLNATISDASGSLVEYGFNVTVGGSLLSSVNGTNAYGSVLTSSFAIPAVGYNESLILDYWYMKSDGIMHEFRASYSIEQVTAYSNQTWAGNRDIAESIPILDRALVVVLILLAVGALAYTFAGLVGSGVAVMMIMGFFSYTGFINPWVFAVPIIGLFFLIIGRSSA